jgi:hypothetical protein
VDDQPVRVLSVPNNGIQPQVVVHEDHVHLAYFAGDAAHGDIFYVRSDDFGRRFSPPVRVNSQSGSAIAIGSIRGAQIAVGKNGRVHVAWNGSGVAEPKGPMNPDSHRPSFPMLYARQNEAGTEFEAQRNLMRETFGLDGGGSVAADRGGNVYVAWHGKGPSAGVGESSRQVWIARSADEGRGFSEERPASHEPTGACGCCGLRVFSDSRGVVFGLYRSATENVHRDIYLLRSSDSGRAFSVGRLHQWDVNACPMSSMALIETQDEVFGAWETQGQVYFAPLRAGVDYAKTSIRTPPGNNQRRKYPTLAGNQRGEILMTWVEGAGWQRGGMLGWQIFDRAGRPVVADNTRRDVPVWSFPAAFARPDGDFTIIV